MDLMDWFFEPFKKYAVFSGRARRKEYGVFVLFTGIIYGVFVFLDNIFFGTPLTEGWGILSTIYYLPIFIPHLTVSIRRLHDVGISGGFLVLFLAPFLATLLGIPLLNLNLVFFLVLLFKDSEIGENKYGPNPKGLSKTD